MIYEKLINKINRNLNSDLVNNINTQYGKTQVLNSNLYFAIPNNKSTSDSSITPQGFKRRWNTKYKEHYWLNYWSCNSSKKTIEIAENNSSEKDIDT